MSLRSKDSYTVSLSVARAVLVLTSVILSGIGTTATQTPPVTQGRCASPELGAAADALAAKFDDRQFIFIGSTHGDAKIEEFLMCLMTRPSFNQRATDIVVEWASAAHQQLLDRYVLTLESIAIDRLEPIWFDTDHPTLWASLPHVRQSVEVLRAVNGTRPPAKRIRLVGGNDPTDWTKVRVAEDLAPYPFKTNLMPHLILEHLAKTPGNRTLVVYGDGHIRHNGANFMIDLEYALGRGKLFVVGTINQLNPEERPYLASIGDTAKPFFAEARRFPSNQPWPKSLRTRLEERQEERLANYIDALLYLGPEADRNLAGSLPLSAAQRSELARRNAIASDPQRSMKARFQGRDLWFRTHPNDLPPRP